MRYAIENSDDEDVIRDIARDKLNLVEPGEEVYYAG
jgi:cell division protein FtsB